MKDVAQRAGVSIQTVSAVVNNKPDISAQTRARVLAVVNELDYQPDLVARSLPLWPEPPKGMLTHWVID
jgi:LacI family transcriptional regulator